MSEPNVRPPVVVARRGGFTRDEKATMFDAYVAGETPEAVGARLGRPAETVRRYFDGLAAKGAGARGELPPVQKTRRQLLLEDLHASPQWRAIREKFEPHEVRLYEDNYALLLEQFGDDVVVTERLQVDEYLTGLILTDRNLTEQKRVRGELALVRGHMMDIRVQNPDGVVGGPDSLRMVQLEDKETNYRDELASLVKEYGHLKAACSKMLSDMKATRAQRMAGIENRVTSILDLVRELMEDDKRKMSGRQAALGVMATRKTLLELATPRAFADGEVDVPVLTAETFRGKD